jgi:hypothetical protein
MAGHEQDPDSAITFLVCAEPGKERNVGMNDDYGPWDD